MTSNVYTEADIDRMLDKISPEARGSFDRSLFNPTVDEEDFRQYARDNDPPETWEKCEIRHPYCRDEWFKLGKLPEKVISFSI